MFAYIKYLKKNCFFFKYENILCKFLLIFVCKYEQRKYLTTLKWTKKREFKEHATIVENVEWVRRLF